MKLKLMQPKFWRNINVISIILFPISLVYYLIFSIIKLSTKSRKIDGIYSISVGNVTVGGGGKTPFSIWIKENLYKENTCFICRGYGAKLTASRLVSDSDSYETVGDEAILLSLHGPTIAGPNKYESVKFAALCGFKYAIIDDGMQHHKLEYNYKYMAIDADIETNKLLLPAGPYRQTFSSGINCSDEIIIIGNSSDSLQKYSYLKDHKKTRFFVRKLEFDDKLKDLNIIAFAGIANPDKFFDSLKISGLKLIKEIPYPDHHIYTEEDINYVASMADKNSAIVTTEKDIVKIPGVLVNHYNIYVAKSLLLYNFAFSIQ